MSQPTKDSGYLVMYCEHCGNGLTVSDFNANLDRWNDFRGYCTLCLEEGDDE